MSRTIFLDPGHGGRDPGALGPGGRRESDDNLRLANAVNTRLIAQGFRVIQSRTTDIAVTLQQRTNQANAQNPDLFISLHRNAFTNPGANGTEIFVFTNPTAAETAAAIEIMDRLAVVGVQSNRGVKRGNFHVLRETRAPAMLIELGFITNVRDNQLFDSFLNEYADAIVMGVCTIFGVTYRAPNTPAPAPAPSTGTALNRPEPTPPAAVNRLYRVQVGAFQVRENAERFLAQVHALGLDAFIIETETPTRPE